MKLLTLLFLLLVNCFHARNGDCQLYLAPSLLPHAGYGIFSGRKIKAETKIRTEPAVLIDDLLLEEYQFSNYFFSSYHGDFGIAVFGVGMMLNHLETPNLRRSWSTEGLSFEIQSVPLRPYTTYNGFDFFAATTIEVGEELYTKYGSSQWFIDRNIPYDPNLGPGPSYSLPELQKVGHCLDDVKIADSNIPMAGRGLFANRNFKKGELVTLSPVLVAPFHQIKKEGASSLLINYCITSPGSPFVILPIGHAAFSNHGGKSSNLIFEWYDMQEWAQNINSSFDSITNRDKIFQSMNKSSIVESPSSNLYLGFYATHDIQMGEELTIDYGVAWEVAYSQYLDSLNYWFTKNNEYNIISTPQFRQPIQAKWNFFPEVMARGCDGKRCSSFLTSRDQLFTFHQQLNQKSKSYQLTRQTIQQSQQYLQQLNYLESSYSSSPKTTTTTTTTAATTKTCENNENELEWSIDGMIRKVKNIMGFTC